MIPLVKMLADAGLDPTTLNIPKGNFQSSNLQTGLQLITGAIAAISLIVIVISGFRYTISRGKPEEISRAKDAIIYAIVGLLIALAAFSIVTFVVGRL